MTGNALRFSEVLINIIAVDGLALKHQAITNHTIEWMLTLSDYFFFIVIWKLNPLWSQINL